MGLVFKTQIFCGKKYLEGIKGVTGVRTVVVPEDIDIIDRRAFAGFRGIKEVILPEGLEKIDCNAFENCTSLKRVYIPSSVEIIGNDAFCGCEKLEIYCEGEPKEGWLDKEETRKEYWDDMTDAFNFHRSAGSFDDHYIVKRVEISHNNYNPDKRPVHTNVSREEYLHGRVKRS